MSESALLYRYLLEGLANRHRMGKKSRTEIDFMLAIYFYTPLVSFSAPMENINRDMICFTPL